MFAGLNRNTNLLPWLICLAYVGLLSPWIRFGNALLIVLIVYCLIRTRPTEIWKCFKDNSIAKIIVGIFLLQVIGLLYTANYNVGFFMLEKKIALLVVPLFVTPLMAKDTNVGGLLAKIGWITLGSSVIMLAVAAFRTYLLEEPSAFFYENLTPIHYVYYSLYFACTSLLLLDSTFDAMIAKKYGIYVILVLFIYCLGLLVLVASKTGIIVFVLASVVFLHGKIKKRRAFYVTIASLVITTALFLYLNKTTRDRFIELTNNLSVITRDEWMDEETFTGLNVRAVFWKISVGNAVKDGHTLTGLGTGDAQDYIDYLYNLPQYQLYGYVGWDPHNQWVFTFVQLGIFAVAVLAFLYGWSFTKAMAAGDYRLIIFLLITFSFSLTESILESNKGIVFFALMFAILTATYGTRAQAS